MSVRYIVKFPHDALTTPAKPVEAFDAELHAFLDDMAETMYAANGVGLAANQVAELRRVTVIDIASEDDESQLVELVNPQVVEREGSIVWEEGCLSFPELYEKIERAAKVRVTYQDRDGEPREIEGTGLLAVALQHEIDHLDGVVFTERLKPVQKRLALKRYERIMARRRDDGIED